MFGISEYIRLAISAFIQIDVGKKRQNEKVPTDPPKKTKESVETAPTEEANVRQYLLGSMISQ